MKCYCSSWVKSCPKVAHPRDSIPRSIKCHYCGPAGIKCNRQNLPVIDCNSNTNKHLNMLNLVGFERSKFQTYKEVIDLKTVENLNFDAYGGALLVGLNLASLVGNIKNLSKANYHCISLTQGFDEASDIKGCAYTAFCSEEKRQSCCEKDYCNINTFSEAPSNSISEKYFILLIFISSVK